MGARGEHSDLLVPFMEFTSIVPNPSLQREGKKKL